MELRADGAVDRRFGRRGTVKTALPGSAEATDVVRQGGGLLVAGTTRRGKEVGEVLLRYRGDGTLDRGFAQGGVAYRRDGAADEGAVGPASCSVFTVAGHIVLVGTGPGRPVSSFSEDGRPEPVRADGRLAPGRRPKLAPGPLATKHGRKLTLVWTTRQRRGRRYPYEPATIDLQQIRSR
jgi:hypothetical protein